MNKSVGCWIDFESECQTSENLNEVMKNVRLAASKYGVVERCYVASGTLNQECRQALAQQDCELLQSENFSQEWLNIYESIMLWLLDTSNKISNNQLCVFLVTSSPQLSQLMSKVITRNYEVVIVTSKEYMFQGVYNTILKWDEILYLQPASRSNSGSNSNHSSEIENNNNNNTPMSHIYNPHNYDPFNMHQVSSISTNISSNSDTNSSDSGTSPIQNNTYNPISRPQSLNDTHSYYTSTNGSNNNSLNLNNWSPLTATPPYWTVPTLTSNSLTGNLSDKVTLGQTEKSRSHNSREEGSGGMTTNCSESSEEDEDEVEVRVERALSHHSSGYKYSDESLNQALLNSAPTPPKTATAKDSNKSSYSAFSGYPFNSHMSTSTSVLPSNYQTSSTTTTPSVTPAKTNYPSHNAATVMSTTKDDTPSLLNDPARLIEKLPTTEERTLWTAANNLLTYIRRIHASPTAITPPRTASTNLFSVFTGNNNLSSVPACPTPSTTTTTYDSNIEYRIYPDTHIHDFYTQYPETKHVIILTGGLRLFCGKFPKLFIYYNEYETNRICIKLYHYNTSLEKGLNDYYYRIDKLTDCNTINKYNKVVLLFYTCIENINNNINNTTTTTTTAPPTTANSIQNTNIYNMNTSNKYISRYFPLSALMQEFHIKYPWAKDMMNMIGIYIYIL